ncbi:hypothetical protein PV392_20230 [Streptomyces sp. ME03-5709C]|nr:hypothetical protein [Streptomyces sp. ME03-5709C]
MSRTSTTKAAKNVKKRRRDQPVPAGNAEKDPRAAQAAGPGQYAETARQRGRARALRPGVPREPGAVAGSASASGTGRTDPVDEAVRIAEAAQAAFDGLYTRNAPALLRQVELLTGNVRLARHAVHRAFDQAWQRWPEVAVDPDPAGWIRAEAHHHALAPWQQLLPRYRTPPRERSAFQRLSPGTRHAVLLHDGLGLSLLRTAAETMATTSMTRRRIVRGREALGEGAAVRLGDLLDQQPQPEYPAAMVRELSEQWLRIRTVGAVVATVLIALVTAVGLVFGPLTDRVAGDRDPVGRRTFAPAP